MFNKINILKYKLKIVICDEDKDYIGNTNVNNLNISTNELYQPEGQDYNV